MVQSLVAPFDAYKGDEPYIFVSYAHKNSEIVFEHITRLRNEGFRIWYDEGIDPGTDWSDEIAKALSKAAVFIVFISPAAVESQNVKKEIVFAIDQRKYMISIHVEDTELPAGLKMQLGNIQSLLEDRFNDREKFYARLFDALPEETRGEDRDGVPVLTALGKAKRRRTQGTTQLKKYKMAFIAAGLVLLVGLSALVAVNLTRNAEAPSSATVTAQTSEVVNFADANLEAAIREALDKRTGALTINDLASIRDTLDLSGKGISDITPLRHLKKLSTLYLDHNRITDISALKGLERLSHLYVGHNRISDLSALREIPNLTELTLDANQIKDVTSVRSLKRLMILSLSNNPVGDLRPISNMKSLWQLSIDGVALQESDLQLGQSLSELKLITVDAASFTNLTEDQIRTFRQGIQRTTMFDFKK